MSQTKTIYFNHVDKLVECLPMDDTLFITKLSKQQLLPGNTQSKLEGLSTQADKASYFLNHVIKPALVIDDTSGFKKLLSVMQECEYEHVKKLSSQISDDIVKLKAGTSVASESREKLHSKSTVQTTGDAIQETQEHYIVENVGSYIISIRTGFTQLFQNLSTDIDELKEVVYKHFLSSILQSSPGDSSGLGPQIPIFVVEIMAQQSASDLFQLLKSKTPYCDIFNFLDFIESITKSIGNEEAKKIVSCSKKAILCMKKDEIIPHMEKENPEKEGFSKVIVQMNDTVDICTYKEIRQFKKHTSFILQLQNLVCFVACDEEHHTVTYLIPSILTERACSSARQVADRFVFNGILHIMIGEQKIEPILQKQESLHLDISNYLWTQQHLVQMVSTVTKEVIPEAEVRNSVVIWLVTKNTNETLATRAYLQQLDDEHVYKFIKHVGEDLQNTKDITYYVGKYGNYPAAVSNVPPDFEIHGTTSSITKITYECFPNIIVVINVGVLCGVEDKVKVCDVLVSSEIVNYDKSGVRGEMITVPPQLTKLFTQSTQWPSNFIKKYLNDSQIPMPNVQSGIILSGPLSEDHIMKEALVKNVAPEAIHC